MTLRRRLMLWLLLAAPLLWIGALLTSLLMARLEINELFDTELVHVARQMQAALPQPRAEGAASVPSTGDEGSVDVKDLLIAVWDRDGHLRVADREGLLLLHGPAQRGFADLTLAGRSWRVYYLPSANGTLVAVGQRVKERRELIWSLAVGPLLPWLLTLPALLAVMALGINRLLKPVAALSAELEGRPADDLRPLQGAALPDDLQPLVAATNRQFERIKALLQRERRFTADAAHELRTPLAALQAQWDAARLAGSVPANEKIGEGLARLGRLIAQMLALARLDHAATTPAVALDWRAVVGQALDEVLPLADRQQVEIACEWPADGAAPLPLQGDPALLAALLRNLLDNALRHAPPGSPVTLRLAADAIEVLDDGPGVAPEYLARLGDRFFRPPGEPGPGSGLGLSIVQRIATLHGLQVAWRNRGERGEHGGFAVRLTRAVA